MTYSSRNQRSYKKTQTIFFIDFIVILCLFIPSSTGHAFEENNALDIPITLGEISRINIGFHHSSFETTHIEFDLHVKDGMLVDDNKKIPINAISPLLQTLHDLTPGTRPLYWQKWTDDYPHGWVRIYLRNGRLVEIFSDSQFENMMPWNIMVWDDENALKPSSVYLLLHPQFPAAMNNIWGFLTGEDFPRMDDDFWGSSTEPLPETITFAQSESYIFEDSNADFTQVRGIDPKVAKFFIPLLSRNAELKALFDDGYTLFDVVLNLTVKTEYLSPLQYAGMIALRSPDSPDVVVTTVVIPMNINESVITPLNRSEVIQQLLARRDENFLNDVLTYLPSLIFITDLRDGVQKPELECPRSSAFLTVGSIYQALTSSSSSNIITFYKIPKKDVWTVDFAISRNNLTWNDDIAQAILENWFPPEYANISSENLQWISTNWGLAFMPRVTLDQPDLIDKLLPGFSQDIKIHRESNDKEGDFAFLKGDARIVINEDSNKNELLLCKSVKPSSASMEQIKTPDRNAPRINLPNFRPHDTGWLRPWNVKEADWSQVVSISPGYVSLIWSDRTGTYYSEGWADGSGWISAQRLAGSSWSPQIFASQKGDIRLIWPAATGSVHVWKPFDREWQKPEYWPDVQYSSEILADEKGALDIIWRGSDGLDEEWMYATWDPITGISKPENVSRRIGGIGNTNAKIAVNQKGNVCAAWGHTLNQKSLPDFITGEISDQSGVFYACRTAEGKWQQPELLGGLAYFAHAVDMEFDQNGNPLIVWQSERGLVSRVREEGEWKSEAIFAEVQSPDDPEPFGPNRWVTDTAELVLGKGTRSEILAGWSNTTKGVNLSIWDGERWSEPHNIIQLNQDEMAIGLRMKVDSSGQPHFVVFKGDELYYATFIDDKPIVRAMAEIYEGYGLMEPELEIDEAGFIYIIGLPRTPTLLVFIPDSGISPTPTIQPSPTSEGIKEIAPVAITLTPTDVGGRAINEGTQIPWLAGLIIAIIIFVVVIIIVRTRSSRN